MNEQLLLERFDRLERLVQTLLQEKVIQKFYSTADVAKVLGKAEFTVREWCRHHRVRAEKRSCGRGNSKEWMISHEELQRIQAEGLLSPENRRSVVKFQNMKSGPAEWSGST